MEQNERQSVSNHCDLGKGTGPNTGKNPGKRGEDQRGRGESVK